jgi:hypothetical protein
LVDAEEKFNGPLGEVIHKILGTQLDRYNTENLSLKFLVRMTNNGKYDAPFGWDQSILRLLADGVPIANLDPYRTPIVSGQSAKEVEFVFVFPNTANNLVLRISHYGDSTEIPINLTATKP